MTLQKIIPTALLVLHQLASASMNTSIITKPTEKPCAIQLPRHKFETYAHKKYEKIEIDFEKKWGYRIPDTLICQDGVYKVVPADYLTQAQILGKKNISIVPLDIQPEIPTTYTQINNTNNNATTDVQRITMHDIENQRKEIEALKTELTIIKKQAENSAISLQLEQALSKTLKECELKINEHTSTIPQNPIKPTQKNTARPNKFNAQKKIAAKKKHLAKNTRNITKNNTTSAEKTSSPQQNPNSNMSQQKMKVMLFLCGKNKVDSPKQLKAMFQDECESEDFDELYGRYDQYCTWKYLRHTNELIIDTDDYDARNSDNEPSHALSNSSSSKDEPVNKK